MIEYGYRVYDGSDGALHFDQIVDGRVYPLRPEPQDAKLRRGYYDPDFSYIGDEPARVADTADIDYPWAETLDWEEGKHHRGQPGNKGQFGPGGGGGGEAKPQSYVRAGEAGEKQPQKQPGQGGQSYVRAGETGEQAPKEQQKALVAKIAGKALGGAKHFVAEDYEILHEHFKAAKAKPGERAKVGQNLRAMAKALPRLAKSHLMEEKEHAVHAVGALKSLLTGNKPTPEQAKGLLSFATRALMVSAGFALGDPTGAAAHGAMSLASHIGEEVVNHVMVEHAVKLFVGGGAGMIKGALAKPSTDADPGEEPPEQPQEGQEEGQEGDQGEMSEEDLGLLSGFLESLAEAMEEMTEQDAHTVLFQGQTDEEGEGEEGGEEGEGEEPDRPDDTDDIDYPKTQDAEWVEAEHPRGQPENAGQFAETQGAGREAAASGRESEAAGREDEAEGAAFVSPSVAEHLDFGEATKGLTSERQKLLSTASKEIDAGLGLKSQSTAAIGAWSDGAENAMLTETRGASWDQLKLAVAMKAWLGDQKDALVFQRAEAGKSALFHFDAKGSLDAIHKALLEDGVSFHTIIPTPGGGRVYAVDIDGDPAVAAAVEKAAKRHGSKITAHPGKAELLVGDTSGTADEQRHKARLAYGGVIKGSGVPGAAELWARVRPTYGQAFEVTEYPKTPTTTALPDSKGGHPAQIASRRPTGVGIPEGDKYRRADLEGMKADARVFKANMDLLKEARAYPQLRPDQVEGKTPEQISRAAIDMAKANLRFLYEHAPPEVRQGGPLWYEGAHDIAANAASKYNLPLQSAAGVYAALSPQKLWDGNVDLGDRLLDIYHTKRDHAWDPKMDATTRRIWKEKDQPMLDRIRGKTLAELQLPVEKAMWIRTYDEAHNPRGFQRLSPDGKPLGPYYNLDGSEAGNGWQNNSAISNAITALESGGNREAISLSMGDRHKVRSFYNNILDPHSANQDVTMDTHAVGAALMSPSTQLSQSVGHSLATSPPKDKQPPGWKGASSSNVTGSSGTYGLWADAYRELAAELKIEPRVLQSVTWVAKRKLFDDRMTAETVRTVNAAWQKYHDGGASLIDTQNTVLAAAGGMDKPDAGVPQPKAVKPPRKKT